MANLNRVRPKRYQTTGITKSSYSQPSEGTGIDGMENS